jgi:hypothetical protein
MIAVDIGHVPIVEIQDDLPYMVGLITRRDITHAYASKAQQECKYFL